MTIDLSDRATGLRFRNPDGGEDVFVVVNDKFPQMGDMHIEGRRTVEVSAELFVDLMAAKGYYVIDPVTGNIAVKKEDK